MLKYLINNILVFLEEQQLKIYLPTYNIKELIANK